MEAMKRILWVGGSKGGVGKSMVTMALLDYLQGNDQKPFLVETDTSNPDVWKAYKDELKHSTINLDGRSGWAELIEVCDSNRESPVVINTAARNNTAVTKNGETLGGTLAELKRQLVVLWVINRQRDSLELLREFMEAVPHAHVHIVRNGYFGDEEKFELYNGSKTRAAIEAKGGKSVTFPDLADRVSDELYTKRLSITTASKEMGIGNRAELNRWKKEVSRVLGEVLE